MFHKSQTAVISTFLPVLCWAIIQSSSWPRLPIPMWAREIRSLAPRILAYETALGMTAAPITAADPARNVLRSVFVSDSRIVLLRVCPAYFLLLQDTMTAISLRTWENVNGAINPLAK